MNKKIPLDSVSRFILILGTVLGITWRYRITGSQKMNPFKNKNKGIIFCFWHSHILTLSYIFRGTGVNAVVSGSKDGDRAAAVAQRWNHETIRGSSSVNALSVLRQCVRELRHTKNIVIVPDGPRGPKEEVKPGTAQIAILAKAPVVAVSAIPRAAWRLKSWDNFMIPKPFTHIDVRISEPITPEQFAHEPDPLAAMTAAIQKALQL
jgi:lysophospholipid acyltransferase (LPLAT)-like uncharacterized protein